MQTFTENQSLEPSPILAQALINTHKETLNSFKHPFHIKFQFHPNASLSTIQYPLWKKKINDSESDSQDFQIYDSDSYAFQNTNSDSSNYSH